MQQPHVIRLETRPPNLEGSGQVSQNDLLRNALRMRPDRIIIGEVRGAEAFDMLQAMNTGHDGSISTEQYGRQRQYQIAEISLTGLLYGIVMTSSSLSLRVCACR